MAGDEEGRSIGDVIDGFGVKADIEDDDLIASVMVLMKVVQPDGQVSLVISHDDSLSWIEEIGMVCSADAILRQTGFDNP